MPAFLDYMDCGTVSAALSANYTTISVSFNFTFASTPIVCLSFNDGGHLASYADDVEVYADSITSSGFTLKIVWTQGVLINSTYTVYWRAMLPR